MKRVLILCLVLISWNLTSYAQQVTKQQTKSESVAIFAGGCFWCMQPLYDKTPGVMKTVVGYTGGHLANPTYQQVSKENTGHVEAIEVIYNPSKVSYKKLLNIYWHNIDPTDPSGQFCDKGGSYRAVIFYSNKLQEQEAKASKEALIRSHRFPRVVTEIKPAAKFYPAEKYHQKYYKKNPYRYKFYRYACGRDARLKQLWGKKTNN